MTLHRPRKRFGQNFLHDQGVLNRIVSALSLPPDAHVIEIGPGRGALTRLLLSRCQRLDVIEIDRDLVTLLKEKFTGAPQLHIHQADALLFDFSSMTSPGDKLTVVGNLPYNISTPLLFHLFQHKSSIGEMLFMLQKEVVERLAACPGSRQYGRLSVMAQYHCQVEKRFNVRPSSFHPAPKVMSAVVRLIPHEKPPVETGDYASFEIVVSTAFNQRRKILRNSLKSLLSEKIIQSCGIDPKARPETLSLDAFACLSRFLARVTSSKFEADHLPRPE